MESKLLPCPFCGGEAEINPAVIPGSIYVACKYCRTASAVYDDEDRAANAWNTRTNRDGLLRAAEIAADIGLNHLKLMALPGAKRPDPAMVAEEIQRAILKEAE